MFAKHIDVSWVLDELRNRILEAVSAIIEYDWAAALTLDINLKTEF